MPQNALKMLNVIASQLEDMTCDCRCAIEMDRVEELYTAVEELVKKNEELEEDNDRLMKSNQDFEDVVRLGMITTDNQPEVEIIVCDMHGDEVDVEVKADCVLEHIAKLVKERDELKGAAAELLEVAEHRGDNALPQPEDDALLWTARMQTAWDEVERVLKGAAS